MNQFAYLDLFKQANHTLEDSIRSCISVMTPYGRAYARDRFNSEKAPSRAITGDKEMLIMQNAKMLHLAITGGAAVELIPHTLENETPLLICVWRSRYETLRLGSAYQRHDFVVVPDNEGENDDIHGHAFVGLANAETAVTQEEMDKYFCSGTYGFMSPEAEVLYAMRKEALKDYK